MGSTWVPLLQHIYNIYLAAFGSELTQAVNWLLDMPPYEFSAQLLFFQGVKAKAIEAVIIDLL